MKSSFKSKIVLLLPLAGLCLAGCANDVSEVFGSSPFDTDDFIDNYFVGRDDLGSSVSSRESKDLANSDIFSGLNDSGSYTGFSTARVKYPNMFLDSKGNNLYVSNTDSTYFADWNAQDPSDEEYLGVSFGRTLCLGKTDEVFKYGVMSKLYDGQLHCLGAYSKARVQLTSDGYTTRFPKTLVSADYLVLCGRWADNSIGLNSNDSVVSDITVSFFKENGSSVEALDVTMDAIPFERNNGGSSTTLFGLKFSDALSSYDLSGVIGMGLSYSNVQDPVYTSEQVVYSNERKDGVINSALMLYEVMLLNSTWR